LEWSGTFFNKKIILLQKSFDSGKRVLYLQPLLEITIVKGSFRKVKKFIEILRMTARIEKYKAKQNHFENVN